jgi:Xaa-Pro aminopeptidase
MSSPSPPLCGTFSLLRRAEINNYALTDAFRSSDRIIGNGDIVSFDTDLVGAHGYSADISCSWVAGDRPPSDEQRRLYALAHEQIDRNVALFRPGASFREIAEKAWQLPEPYRGGSLPALAHGIGLQRISAHSASPPFR